MKNHPSSSEKTRITPNIPVCEVLTRFPETRKVFRHYNIEIDEESPEYGIHLGAFLKQHHIDKTGFIKLLEEQLPDPSTITPSTLVERGYDQHDINFLALLPCPVKVPFDMAFADLLSKAYDNNPPFTYLLESNANNQLSYYDYVKNFTDINQMPDIVISPGLNGYYYRNFFDKFRKRNLFMDPIEHGRSPYKNLDLQDPEHQYSVIGANIEVLMVDHTRLGDLEVPERWSDLLKPEYENSLTIRGQDGFFCETVLLTIYSEYGIEGVRQFAKTVQKGSHPSEMVKAAKFKRHPAPPISILPLFFAKLAEKSSEVSIIWPEEGPIVSPVTMIVKREHQPELDPLISFLAGEKTGSIFSNAAFPSMTGVPPCVDPDAKFNWIGWDYINTHDIGAEIDQISSEFTRLFYGKTS
ncbi:ABC transporter substrate-binding protein [Methanospirillum lacunae]|uniref:ABC transporter substrate-binding protein n=1 Tax=Methanospirillum lacunae TaxID=668570 RepID=A0A2V2MYH6_9EURY|nr:ABC transporter substrate-binding protein [Methanospirillum lacunae]PWR71330.1 ABC transporter substrate-binding protein [Methanospirillum lacunae]